MFFVTGCMYLTSHNLSHCKPGEAYTHLITASCKVGPGTTHMCTFEICMWSLQILEFADRCVFHTSIFRLSKCHLYREIMKYLKSSCQGSNHHSFNGLWSFSVSKIALVRIEPLTFSSCNSSLHHYTIVLSYILSKM